jgi:3-deoxy-D-manno-octulosonic-acid transferase
MEAQIAPAEDDMRFGQASRFLAERTRFLADRCGLALPLCRRSVWVHGETPLQFDAARQLIQAIVAERPHVGLVVTSGRLSTFQFLRDTFTNEQIFPAPYGAAAIVRRFLRRLQVRHILLLDGGRSVPRQTAMLAVSQNIPISAINVGSPAALDGSLLEACRRLPNIFRLCVHGEAAALQLREMGMPGESIAVTGCLDLDEGRGAHWPSATAARRLLRLREDTPVVVAVDVPGEEEGLILDAFAEARSRTPGLRLLMEPRRAHYQLARLRNEIERRGWISVTMSSNALKPEPAWDVLVETLPGLLTAFLPLAAVVIAGGTYSGEASGAYVAASISAGASTMVGPRREFLEVPWQTLKLSPLIRRVEAEELGGALCAAIQYSPARLEPGPVQLPGASRRTYAAISAMLPDSPALPIAAQDWRVPTLRDQGSSNRVWRRIAPVLMTGRIDSLEDLNAHLGHPRSVLCLGNGPSSEDPRLASIEHQCLIRVNWRWKLRGFLANPQIVFVGDPDTVHKVKQVVFGFWNTSLEYGMLLRHLLTRGLAPMKYFTVERIPSVGLGRTWRARPTNGALMIATAAALAPERLIIGGVDLYLNPDGRYPGDLLGNNQYARSHSRDMELELIRAALANYRGELIILSDLLRTALETRGGASRAWG